VKIEKGRRVVLKYELYDLSDELLETSEEGEPMEYVHGAEEISPALERALAGKEPGDSVRVTLPPEEAFGERDEDLLVTVPRAEIPPEIPLSVGEYLPVALEEAPEDLADEEIEFRIIEIGEEEVVLDANHPLAGETVTFVLEVVSVT